MMSTLAALGCVEVAVCVYPPQQDSPFGSPRPGPVGLEDLQEDLLPEEQLRPLWETLEGRVLRERREGWGAPASASPGL